MEAKTKILRSKISLQIEKPFFAYLISNMKFVEREEVGSMGVDINGNCFYAPKFIGEISEGELKGVLAHEVMHLVLEHIGREEKRKPKLFNIACDLCINDILIKNNFELPRSGLIPDYNHNYEFENSKGKELIIKDIDKKSAEVIYEELLKLISKDKSAIDKMNNKRFDEHILGELKAQGKGDGKGNKTGKKSASKQGVTSKSTKSTNKLTQEQKQALKDKWKKALSEASAYARQKGNMPDGLELFVDGLLNEKVNWKTLLYKYLTRTIPFDYSYARPSKRSHAVGVYMPIMRKESIEIVVSLDTSGSIGGEELTEFMSEINGIARSFNNLSMKLIVCDSEIKDVYDIGNGSDDEIAKLIIRGGGGTSHLPVYDYVMTHLPNTRLLVNFTDGYTDFEELDNTINTLWVICKHGVEESRVPFGEVIKLD